MPTINCDRKQCPFNIPNPSMEYLTCAIDMLSLVDGKCEFWEAYNQANSEAKEDV